MSAVAGAGGMAALFVAYQLATGVMSRATGEYVRLPDRVGVLETTTAKHAEWIADERAAQKAAKEAAQAAAAEAERRAIWKDRAEGERKRDERLERILQAIADCRAR